MENKYYYGFKFIFEFNSVDVILFNNEYLDVGFSYLGYIVRNRIYKDLDFKYRIDIKNIINLLIIEFNRLLKLDEIFKYINLNYDVMYKELEDFIKINIEKNNNLIEVI